MVDPERDDHSGLAAALEGVCFALNRPLRLADAAAILGCSAAAVEAASRELAESLRERGLMLQRHREELQLVTRPAVAWAVQRALSPERPARLSKPAMEALAIVAYRQPATRASVEAIRGVNCDAVLENLERRGLIAEVGRQDTPGRPRLFGTTLHFLQMVGLERIEDLPPLPAGSLPAFLDGGAQAGPPPEGGGELAGDAPDDGAVADEHELEPDGDPS